MLPISDDINVLVLVNSLATLSTFITTVSATSLVVLKITLVARQSQMRHSYTKIIEIIIESAGLVSIVLLGMSILDLLSYVHPFDPSTTLGTALNQTYAYLSYCQAPITVRFTSWIHN